MKTIREVWVKNLNDLIGEKSKKVVAAEAKIPYSTLFNMLKGHIADGANLKKLATYFGVDEPHLFLDPDLAQKSEPPTPGIVELAAKVAEQAKEIEHLKATIAQLQEKPGKLQKESLDDLIAEGEKILEKRAPDKKKGAG